MMSITETSVKRKGKRGHSDSTQLSPCQYTDKFLFETITGEYGFKLDFTYPSQNIIHLHEIEKICITFSKLVPIRFSLSTNISKLPADCLIRTTVLYQYRESELCTRMSPAVTRCYNHQQEGTSGLHVVTSPMSGNVLSASADNGALSVTVPLGSMQREGDVYTALYKFCCFTSCYRDPLQIVFELLAPGENLLGRASLGLRVCACPKRDSKVALGKLGTSVDVSTLPPKKKRKTAGISDSEADAYFGEYAVGEETYTFVWELNDRNMFEYLQTIKRGYERDRKRYLKNL